MQNLIHTMQNNNFRDLSLLSCGTQDCLPSYSYGPAARSNYVIHFVTKGKGYYYVEGKRYALEENQGFLIKPNVITFYHADAEDPWSYSWVDFKGERAEVFLRYIGLEGDDLTFTCENGALLKQYVDEIIAHNTMNFSDELYAQGMLLLFFSCLAKSVEKPYKKWMITNTMYINQCVDFIQKNYQNPITVADLADYVSLNRCYLTTIFKNALQMSPQQYLKKYRMTQAAHLLATTEFTVNEIARSCGYTDPLAFSKTFKTVQGLTPTQFRKEKTETVIPKGDI